MSPPKMAQSVLAARTSLTVHNSTYPFIDPSRHANKLVGKTAIITGGGGGLGAEISQRFFDAGANVILVGRRPDPINNLAAKLNSIRANSTLAIPADVADPTAAERVMQATIAKFGSVDILINNAAINRVSPFAEESDMDYYWKVIEVNVRGPMLFTHAALKHMKPRNRGTIITISGTVASLDLPYMSSYGTSKAAMLKFTQSISLELKKTDVRLFSVHPGYVKTEMGSRDNAFSETGSKDPEVAEWFGWVGNIPDQSPDLSANTCVALCVEEDARLLTGRFVNSLSDLGEILEDARLGQESKIVKEKLYWQTLEEL